jgi:SAM-dependent methyltransferase
MTANGMDDSGRPPVLAQQRFAADRAAFAGLNLAQRFQRIHDTNLWGAEQSISGLGSEIEATAVLREELSRLVARLGITSLLDAPCGDGGWINASRPDVRYVGVDIVPDLIARLQARVAAGEIGGHYLSPISPVTPCRGATRCCAATASCICRLPTSHAP